VKFQRDIVDIYQMEPRQTVDDIKGPFRSVPVANVRNVKPIWSRSSGFRCSLC